MIVYDEDGRLTSLQKKYKIPYPNLLKQNIIRRNMDLLRYAMPAYEVQIVDIDAIVSELEKLVIF